MLALEAREIVRVLRSELITHCLQPPHLLELRDRRLGRRGVLLGNLGVDRLVGGRGRSRERLLDLLVVEPLVLERGGRGTLALREPLAHARLTLFGVGVERLVEQRDLARLALAKRSGRVAVVNLDGRRTD